MRSISFGNLFASNALQPNIDPQFYFKKSLEIWRQHVIRKSELELHAMAKALFESENVGRVWNIPTNAPSRRYRYAGLMERQNYLARVREQMRREEQEVDQ